MNQLYRKIYQGRNFFLSYLVFTIVVSAFYLKTNFVSFSPVTFSSDFNQSICKSIMVNITFMGDAFFSVLLVIFLASYFNQRQLSLKVLAGFVVTILLVQIGENIIIPDHIQLYFENSDFIQKKLPVKIKETQGNMISSHTALAFMLAGVFSIHYKSQLKQFLYLSLAILVGLSRIYLANDSIITVLFGSIFGAFGVILIYIIKIKTLQIINYRNKTFNLRLNLYKKSNYPLKEELSI